MDEKKLLADAVTLSLTSTVAFAFIVGLVIWHLRKRKKKRTEENR